MASDYEDITSAVEYKASPMLADRAAAARRNTSIEPVTGTQAETVGVDRAVVIDLMGKGEYPPAEEAKLRKRRSLMTRPLKLKRTPAQIPTRIQSRN